MARRHANALSTKAAQIRMALRHHERNFATRSAHTLQAITSHDTANHPAHQGRAAFTPACFALPSGTAPRQHTFHQGHANSHGTATANSAATRRFYTSMFRTPQWHGATPTHFPPRRKSAWHCDRRFSSDTPRLHQHVSLPSGTAPRKRNFHQVRANPHGTAATSRT